VSKRQLPTMDRLLELLIYSPESGLFTRRTARGNAAAGSLAGTASPRGYLRIAVDGVEYPAHRLAWVYMTGCEPSGDIDHRDGCTSNNRWDNLRDVSHRTNGENQRRPSSNNKTGFLGVHKNKSGSFVAEIRVDGALRYLGTPELASDVYLAAKRQLHQGCTL